MTDYSVIKNVNVFVRLSGFIHLTSRRVLLESSTRTALFRSFLGLLGETTPTTLGSRHRSHLWSHMSHPFETSGRNRRIWKSLVGQTRRSACDIVGPRATARNATYTKTSQRNKTYISLFSILHVYRVFRAWSHIQSNLKRFCASHK